MLVIDRKIGQSVVIGANGDTVITLLRNKKDGSIAIGFTAPKSIQIDRQEVFKKRQQNSPPKPI